MPFKFHIRLKSINLKTTLLWISLVENLLMPRLIKISDKRKLKMIAALATGSKFYACLATWYKKSDWGKDKVW